MIRKFRKRKFKEKKCKDCGKTFNTWSHNAFRCPECRRKFYLDYLRNYNKKPRVKKEKIESSPYINYSQGNLYCNKYNNDDIKCVVCYEQRLKNTKGCYE